MFQLTDVPVMSDVVDVFLSSTVVLTPNGQFFNCVTIAFSERYVPLTELNSGINIYIYIYIYIQGVPGGKDLTSGECSLGQNIPI